MDGRIVKAQRGKPGEKYVMLNEDVRIHYSIIGLGEEDVAAPFQSRGFGEKRTFPSRSLGTRGRCAGCTLHD
jgi:hypothetical protein